MRYDRFMSINIKPSQNVKELAKLVGSDFYIVGGFVRNKILGIKCEEEDLCSPLTIDELEKKLAKSNFSLKYKNKSFGTCKIICGNKSYDYATFRKEVYKKGHCPDEVEFVNSIQEDVKRRDFTANSIYYNLKTQEIIDPLGGINDLQKRLLRATSDDILKNDGLRILRMIRLASEYGLKIEKNTYSIALANTNLINDLSKSKVIEEIKKLLRQPSTKTTLKALKLYNKLNIWNKLGLQTNKIKFKMVAKCEDRTLGLAIDLVDTIRPASVSYFLTQFLEDSGLTKKQLSNMINVLSGYYDALNHLQNKAYFFKYFENFPEIYKLLSKKSSFLAQKYNFFYKYIISHKLVISVNDLKITKKELKKAFPSLPAKMYDKVLLDALSEVFEGKCPNTSEELLKYIGKKHYHII